MEINNRASIDIMGFSLCLDDSNSSTNLPTTANIDILTKNKNFNNMINNANLNSLNTNSFYIANEEDATVGLDDHFLFSNRQIPLQRNNINSSNNDDINNLKKIYVSSSNVPINKSNASNGNNIMTNIEQSNNQNNSSNSNLTELDNVKHKLSSFWNNVKYGKFLFNYKTE